MAHLQRLIVLSILFYPISAHALFTAVTEGIPASNNTVYVDTVNVRVGVGTSSPTKTLHVNGDMIASSGTFTGTLSVSSNVSTGGDFVFKDGSHQATAASGTGSTSTTTVTTDTNQLIVGVKTFTSSVTIVSSANITGSLTITGGLTASSATFTGTGTNITVSSNIVLAGGAIRFPDGSLQNTAATSGGGGSSVHVAFASTTFVGSQATTGSALACISGATVTFIIANAGDPVFLSSDISWSGSVATNYVGLGFFVDDAVITGENTSFGVAIFDTLTLLPRQNNTAVATSQALSAGFHSACLAWSYSAGTATHINGQTDIFSVFEIQK